MRLLLVARGHWLPRLQQLKCRGPVCSGVLRLVLRRGGCLLHLSKQYMTCDVSTIADSLDVLKSALLRLVQRHWCRGSAASPEGDVLNAVLGVHLWLLCNPAAAAVLCLPPLLEARLKRLIMFLGRAARPPVLFLCRMWMHCLVRMDLSSLDAGAARSIVHWLVRSLHSTLAR